jgi:hypothetical protein
MAEATPKAEELAAEKGIDLDSVEGSGKEGRVLIEDVEKVIEEKEAVMEPEHPAEDAEIVGEVAGDPLVVSQPSPETSVEAFKAHPHVPVSEQTPEELKDFDPESLATVEGTEEAAQAEAEAEGDSESEAAEEDYPEEGGPGSTDWIRNRGFREKGFYVLPDEVNPHVAEAQRVAADAEASQNEEASSEEDRPAEQESQVDTSSGSEGEPTHGESLKEAAPAVAELTEAGDDDESNDDS